MWYPTLSHWSTDKSLSKRPRNSDRSQARDSRTRDDSKADLLLPSQLDAEALKRLREKYPSPDSEHIKRVISEMFGDPPPDDTERG